MRQAKDKGKKDMEKAKKVIEPLLKKLAEDPGFMATLATEIEALTREIESLKC